MIVASAVLAAGVMFASSEGQMYVDIPISDVVKIARIIAKDEGYDVSRDDIYYFDTPVTRDGSEILPGYRSIIFYIHGDTRNLISISESTGQALDMNGCEIFDYPELRPFQKQIMRITKAKRKTPRQLAKDADCDNPIVRTKPEPVVPWK